ncbi:MAG: hypothetical protein QOJ03_1713 [Frankiaceae bacterium]|jgi:hypothetical protein|nr:hypothetical protein [Frankiaceae bacterium]
MSAVRDLGLVAAACLAASALTLSPAYAAAGVAGQWTATDGDGSNLSLSIHGGSVRYAVREVDDAATVCGGAPASVNGAGKAEGELLVVQATLACAPGGNVFRQRIEITFTHSATDTLTDNDGVVWTRAS